MSVTINGIKKITELPLASAIGSTDTLIVETSGGTKKVSGTYLKNLINNNIANNFDSSTSYTKGDYVIYNDKLYKFITNHSGAFDTNNVIEVTLTDEIKKISYPAKIEITTSPAKTQYEADETFDKTGMVVTLSWSTGETTVLDNADIEITPSILTDLDTQNVTLSYKKIEPYVLTTSQPVQVKIIPDTWEKIIKISKTGKAPSYFKVGDAINDTYTVNNTEYTNPWIIMDFRTVELENGEVYQNVPIVQMQYLTTDTIPFDAPQQFQATETNALSNLYYFGYVAEGTVYTPLNLMEGDLIPYSNYDKIFKTPWNSVNHIRYGLNNWKFSFMRQYLNNSGTEWAAAQHTCDVLPTGAETKLGFKSYISAQMAAALHPIKIQTNQNNLMGGEIDITYDTFWLPSVSEMNLSNGNASVNDGEPWQYYKELLSSETKLATGTYQVLKKYRIDATSSAQWFWLRSAYLGYSYYEWYVNGGGNVSIYNASNSNRVCPCCALI